VRRLLSCSGISMFEVVTAIGLISIMAIFAIPGMMRMQTSLRLTDARRQVASDLQLARMKAISQHTKYRLAFGSLPSASYSIEKFDGATFATQSGPFALPEGITVTSVSPSSSEFQSGGTANTASTITLSNGSTTGTVEVSLIGRVKIP
jgi:Tfp pilus assembly protein FimT